MKIGLIGYGYWGKFVARAIARVGELSVIVDQDPKAAVLAHETWGPWGTKVTSEASLAHELCDAVWIATPNRTHYNDVFDALNRGLHVLCEKPFVTSVSEASVLVEEAEQLGVALMVGHLQLYTEVQAEARMLVNQHGFGIAGDHKCETASLVRRNVRASLSDGSVLWGIGPHDVAAMIDLWGTNWEVESCDGTTHRIAANLWFPDHKIGVSLELDWLAEERKRMFFIGDRDVALTENVSEPLLVEAQTFNYLCENPERASHHRREAVDVTRMLAELETAMSKVRAEV